MVVVVVAKRTAKPLLQWLIPCLVLLFFLFQQMLLLLLERDHNVKRSSSTDSDEFVILHPPVNTQQHSPVVCKEDSSQEWTPSTVVDVWDGDRTVVPIFHLERDLVRVTSVSSFPKTNTEAKCYFGRFQHSPHFPHAMQQLYRCWSYFRSHLDKQAVLLYPQGHPRFPETGTVNEFTRDKEKHKTVTNTLLQRWKQNELKKKAFKFLEGFLGAMENDLNVILRPIINSSSHAEMADSVSFIKNGDAEDGYGITQADAQTLVDRILGQSAISDTNNYHACICGKRPTLRPRVAILNRNGSRTLLNAEPLAVELRQALGLDRVPVFSFEVSKDKNQFGTVGFLGQASFFAQTDILISPHGAQLTGIPFMARRPCGGFVLEIFPEGYCLPYFFGSLAISSGLNHSYVALGDGPCRALGGSRSVELCPPISIVVNAVKTLARKWELQCCCGGKR